MIAHGVTGSGFRGVVSYLATGSDRDRPERVAWNEARNLASDDLEWAPAVMRHTANHSVRCKKPVYHFSISWPESDQVDRQTMTRVADRTLADLGLSDHQALIVAHNDTEHPHLHVVVNRVHPETGKAWSTSHDRKRLMESLRAQERELGLEYVPNRLTDPDRAPELPPSPSRGEVQRARHQGGAPLVPFAADRVAQLKELTTEGITQAEGWRDIEAGFAAQGVELRPKGRGYIITDGRGYAKLSQLGKPASASRLAERFGQSWQEYDKAQEDKKPARTDAQARDAAKIEKMRQRFKESQAKQEKNRDKERDRGRDLGIDDF